MAFPAIRLRALFQVAIGALGRCCVVGVVVAGTGCGQSSYVAPVQPIQPGASVQLLTTTNAIALGAVTASASVAIAAAVSAAVDQNGVQNAFPSTTIGIGTGSAVQTGVQPALIARLQPQMLRPVLAERTRTRLEVHSADDTGLRQLRALGRATSGIRRFSADSTIPSILNVGTTTANIWVAVFALGSSSVKYVSVPATLEAQTLHGNVWIDNSLINGASASPSFAGSAAQTTSGTIGQDFENAYASDTAHFASPDYPPNAPAMSVQSPSCDSSGNSIGTVQQYINEPLDKRINFVIVNPKEETLGADVGGYFSADNYVPQSALNCLLPKSTAKSNEAQMFYLGWNDVNGATFELGESMVTGSAHELQHLINFVNHSILPPAASSSTYNGEEDSWINEGLSMLAQDLSVSRMYPGVGFDSLDALTHAATYLSVPQNFSLTQFRGIDPKGTFGSDGVKPVYNCGGGCYGIVYLFARYMHDRFGGDTYTQALETSGLAGFPVLAAGCRCGERATQLIEEFAIALSVNTAGVSTSNPAYQLGTLNITHGKFPSQLTEFTGTTLNGLNLILAPNNQLTSASAPLGGFAFFSLTSPGGEHFSIRDDNAAEGFVLNGALIQR